MIQFGQLGGGEKETRGTSEEEREQLLQTLLSQQKLIGRMMEKSLMSHWLELDLTMSQLKILFLLHTHSWLRLSKLADATKQNLASVNEMVDKLVEHRLVVRAEHNQDHRVVIVAISEEGRSLCETLTRSGDEKIVHLLQKLSFEELNALAQATDIFLKAVVGSTR